MEKLSDDLKDLMLCDEESDITVRVQGVEFHLHRNVLGARSPVFKSMLWYDMQENTRGSMRIDDCTPDTFRMFIHFVYSGRMDELSTDTVFGLYVLADKYEVEDLKFVCLSFIQRTLSVETFCDITRLAFAYDLRDLLECVTDYFTDNTSAIIKTVKWMSFMKYHNRVANGLYLIALIKNDFWKNSVF